MGARAGDQAGGRKGQPGSFRSAPSQVAPPAGSLCSVAPAATGVDAALLSF